MIFCYKHTDKQTLHHYIYIISIIIIITVQTGRSKTSKSQGRWLAPKLISSRQAPINNKDTDTDAI